MDPTLKAKIIARLTTYLNRAPFDHEVINGQNDATLMQWIAKDDITANATAIASLQLKALNKP